MPRLEPPIGRPLARARWPELRATFEAAIAATLEVGGADRATDSTVAESILRDALRDLGAMVDASADDPVMLRWRQDTWARLVFALDTATARQDARGEAASAARTRDLAGWIRASTFDPEGTFRPPDGGHPYAGRP